MMYDREEEIIKEALNKVNTPEYDLKREVREKIIAKHRPLSVKRKLNMGIIVVVIILLSGTVLASNISIINRLISIISPEMTKLLQTIQGDELHEEGAANSRIEKKEGIQGVVSEGIEIKPLAVVNDDDMMIIYLTIQDLTQNRIDESLSVQEYFVEGGMINNAQLIDYDKESKTGIIQITTQGGNELNNSNIALQISALATNKRELNQVPINIDLEQITDKTENDIRKMSRGETTGGGGTGDMWDILEKQGGIEVLKIKGNPMEINIPEIDGVVITNVGFINNRLHIQTKWEKNDKDRHGYFYLIDEEGNKIEVKENNFSLVLDNNNEEVRDRHIEYILDVDKETAKHMRLMGYFAEDGEVIQGKWNLEIDLDAAGEIIKIPCDIQANTWNIKEVSLSPLGVTLKGTGTVGEKINCSILMESGEIREFDSVSTSNQAGDITMKFGAQVPLNVSTVTSIQIGKDTINFK